LAAEASTQLCGSDQYRVDETETSTPWVEHLPEGRGIVDKRNHWNGIKADNRCCIVATAAMKKQEQSSKYGDSHLDSGLR
jgi:hypothetical protein